MPSFFLASYIGCIGGCDEMLTEALGIRPLSGPTSGIPLIDLLHLGNIIIFFVYLQKIFYEAV